MYVFDLDGTIALNQHRQHLLQGEKKRWDEFSLACVDDEPNTPLISVMHALDLYGYEIAILSGRGMIAHEHTLAWLNKHDVPYCHLSMRSVGDHRDDCDLKLEMMQNLQEKFPHHKIRAVFDDRQKVVDMWRREGYTCFQVAPGAF